MIKFGLPIIIFLISFNSTLAQIKSDTISTKKLKVSNIKTLKKIIVSSERNAISIKSRRKSLFKGESTTLPYNISTTSQLKGLKVDDSAKKVIYVTAFGAKGDGVTNDFVSIRRALESLPNNCTLKFPSGDFFIGGQEGLKVEGLNIRQSNIKITGSKQTRIIQNPYSNFGLSINAVNGGTKNYDENAKRLTIENITFVASTTVNGFSEFQYLLNINAATDVVVQNCKFIGFRGDGIYIGSSNIAGVERHNKNIVIRDCYFDGVNNDNRNAISVIDVDGLLITNNYFVNCTRSNMPGAIDIEPNTDAWATVKNITIENNFFSHVGGNVGVISLSTNSEMTKAMQNIQIDGNYIDSSFGSGAGISLITGKAPTEVSEPNHITISRNTIASSSTPLNIFGCKNVVIDNNYISQSISPIHIGFHSSLLPNTACMDISLKNNTLTKLGAKIRSGISFFNVDKLNIEGNRFIDIYGYAMSFDAGASRDVQLIKNKITSPSFLTTYAVVKESAHVFNPATNVCRKNDFGKFPSQFPCSELK